MSLHEKPYRKALVHKAKGEYDLALEVLHKAIKAKNTSATLLYEAGVISLAQGEQEEGFKWLQKALKAYQKKIKAEENAPYHLFCVARIYMHMQEEQKAISNLKKAINLNLQYAEKTFQDKVFAPLKQNADFLKFVQPKRKKLKKLQYKGKKLSLDKLNPKQLRNRNMFLNILKKNDWVVNDFAELLKEGLGIAPQALGEYTQNSELYMRLSYYADNDLIYMELQNRFDEDDMQGYRLYTHADILELLATIASFQDKINSQNWESFIEALIPTCYEVQFEMPDGRTVKVS